MNLYLLSQNVNNDYDTYDSIVVAAENEEEARTIQPQLDYKYHDGKVYFQYYDLSEVECSNDTWALPEDIKVKFIGISAPGIEKGVIIASFNAG